MHFYQNKVARHEVIEVVARTSMDAWFSAIRRLKAMGVITERQSNVKIGVRVA
jgi:hypothetical protein